MEIGLDGRPFEEGQRSATAAFKKTQDAALEFGKGLEEKAGKLADLFSVAKKGALGLVGAFAGFEVSGFLNNVLAMDATTGRLARSLGQSTENLSKWEGMVRAMGGSAGDAQRVFAGVTDAINQYMATTGLPPPALMSLLNRTGVGMSEFTRNPNAAWDRISDFLVAENTRQPGMGRFWGQQIPGMTESFLNTLLLGSKGMAELRKEIEGMGFATEQSAHDAMMFQMEATGLEVALENLGRETFPTLIGIVNKLTGVVRSLKDAWAEGGFWNIIKKVDEVTDSGVGPVQTLNWVKNWIKSNSTPGITASLIEQEFYIREQAKRLGIDPGVAVRVARSEGLHGYVGDKGSSFGPYQLHYGGIAPGMMNPGLGDEFTKHTGLDARDPSTWREQVRFALEYAKTSGWGPWHGWKGLPWAGISPGAAVPSGTATFKERWQEFSPGAGAAARGIVNSTSNQHSSNVNVNIGTVTVQTAATDAGAMSRDVASQLRKNLAAAMNFNSSMTG